MHTYEGLHAFCMAAILSSHDTLLEVMTLVRSREQPELLKVVFSKGTGIRS